MEILSKLPEKLYERKEQLKDEDSSKLENYIFLFINQLRYQDPVSPMEVKDFSQMLGNMVAVQQSIKTTQLLERLVDNKTTNTNISNPTYSAHSAAQTYIGREIVADGSKSINSDNGIEFFFNADEQLENAKVSIYDPHGNIVHSETIDSLNIGKNKFHWEGITDIQSKNVEYSINVTAENSEGKISPIDYTIKDRVKGINLKDPDKVLLILEDGSEIDAARILKIWS